MRTILVSGASGIVGYGVLRSLRQTGKSLRLIGTSIYDDSVAPAFCDVFERAPATNDPSYVSWLLETISKHKIDMVIPGIEIDMSTWVDHAEEIRARGAVPLLNDPSLIRLCTDKWAFYQALSAANMPCAIESSLSTNFDELATRFGLPFLLKPRRGFGSKGIVLVSNEAMFAARASKIGSALMAQPIVGTDDEEFTISAFCDGYGEAYASMSLRRRLGRDGFTEKAEVASTEPFASTIACLCRLFRPIGPTNFQFRMTVDGVKLLEINPRISSSTAIRAAFGYNESEMAADFFLEGKTPIQPAIRAGKAVRYTDEYIFYADRVYL